MITIDRDKAIELLTAAVEEMGREHVVYSCVYAIDTDRPGCIVGNALFRVMGEDTFASAFCAGQYVDSSPVNSSVITAIGDYLKTFGVHIDNDAMHLFSIAQEVQDRRFGAGLSDTWGSALDTALAGTLV